MHRANSGGAFNNHMATRYVAAQPTAMQVTLLPIVMFSMHRKAQCVALEKFPASKQPALNAAGRCLCKDRIHNGFHQPFGKRTQQGPIIL